MIFAFLEDDENAQKNKNNVRYPAGIQWPENSVNLK